MSKEWRQFRIIFFWGGDCERFLPCPFLPSFQKKLTYDWKEGRSEAFVQETSKEEQVTSSGDEVGARGCVCVCARSLAGVAPVIQERCAALFHRRR